MFPVLWIWSWWNLPLTQGSRGDRQQKAMDPVNTLRAVPPVVRIGVWGEKVNPEEDSKGYQDSRGDDEARKQTVGFLGATSSKHLSRSMPNGLILTAQQPVYTSAVCPWFPWPQMPPVACVPQNSLSLSRWPRIKEPRRKGRYVSLQAVGKPARLPWGASAHMVVTLQLPWPVQLPMWQLQEWLTVTGQWGLHMAHSAKMHWETWGEPWIESPNGWLTVQFPGFKDVCDFQTPLTGSRDWGNLLQSLLQSLVIINNEKKVTILARSYWVLTLCPALFSVLSIVHRLIHLIFKTIWACAFIILFYRWWNRHREVQRIVQSHSTSKWLHYGTRTGLYNTHPQRTSQRDETW